MFTDIVDSAKMKQAVEGETSARRDSKFIAQIKKPHDELVNSCVREAGGHKINSTGDGYCLAFYDVEEAVLCALRIQRRLTAAPIDTPLGALRVRIGLHTGMAGDNVDYNASTVDKAARVQGRADGGEVLLSRETHALVAGKIPGVQFNEAGEFELKGFDPERLFRAAASDSCSLEPPVNESDAPATKRKVSRRSATVVPPVEARLQNPYDFSGAATSRTFKGRENELDELVDSIESGTHTAIFGLQRMGKTSLIKEGLEERLNQNPDLAKRILVADIDLMKLGGDEVTYKDLFHAIVQAIFDRLLSAGVVRRVEGLRNLTAELWATSRYERGDRTHFFSTVARVLRGISDVARRRIVLFIDEFSELRRVLERNKRALSANPLRTKNLLPHEMYVDLPFVHHLSALLKDPELKKRFTLIAAVRPFMAEYDTTEGLQILKLMKPITLYYLDEPAATALITEPVAGQVEYEEGVPARLYALTAGHPYLLQFMLKHLVDRARRGDRATVTLADVAAVEERMIHHGPAYDAQFEVVISDYSVAEVMDPQEALLGKGTLAVLAKLSTDVPGRWVKEGALLGALQEHGISPERASSLLAQLVRTKIVDEDNAGDDDMRYRVTIPLLQKRLVRQNLYLKYFR
jgi:class 3 adenylate cyclase